MSLRLLPAGTLHFRPVKLTRYAAHFVYQSVAAGIDVARLALDPRMPLQPGFVIYRPRLSPGATLDAFCTVSSLLPGTLPSGSDASGGLAIHCLDVTQPIADQMAEEEAAVRRKRLGKGATMTDFYLAVGSFILAMVALGLFGSFAGQTPPTA